MSERDPLNLLGQTIAEKYRIERLVGEGGFAVVYRAQHTIWNKPVAIKFFSGLSSAPIDQRGELQTQFIQEGALLTELSSQTASIVQARDVGTTITPDGQWMPYMVLEWLEGRSLEEILEQEQRAGLPPWSVSQALAVVGQVAAALDVAHRRGIAHRDIKPANLFVIGEPRAPGATVKVLDFGVAKMMAENTQIKAALAKTGQNITSFTPKYGAPEQFSRSYGATGPWTDVYALALVAVEMLVGRPALDGDDLVQLAFSTGNPERRPTPRAYGLDLGDALEGVFLRALAVDPKQRLQNAGEMWAAVTQAAGGGVDTGATLLAPPSGVRAPMPSLTATVQASTSMPGVVQTTNPTTIPAAQGGGKSAGLVVAGVLGVVALGAAAFFGLKGRGPAHPTAGPVASEPAASAASSPPAAPPPPASCPTDMVLIRAGQFFMGSDLKDARDNEKPAHNVKLSSFCIDRDEVTSARYKECSDSGKCKKAPNEVEWPGIKDRDRKLYSPLCTGNDIARADHPINCVDWEMAKTYCEAQGRRLPTEAEWEYTARGPDGRVYPWGDEDPTAKHLNACGRECVRWGAQHGVVMEPLYDADDGWPGTAPVGTFPLGSSRFGPRDVVGNVWEWVSDWDGQYTAEARENPTGSPTGERKIIRGGAFNGWYKDWLRPSFRYAQVPGARSHGIGFRCARPLEG